MKIGIIQATSQKSKNKIIEDTLLEVVSNKQHEVVNFGMFGDEEVSLSYVQIALCISLLLKSKAVDFIVTGCSSGQGMMLACNSLPGVLCGYVGTVSDAYLFGRINNGNAISYPLGLNWGWAAEINLKETLHALFCEPQGNGYPVQDAGRKIHDARQVLEMNRLGKKSLRALLPELEKDIVIPALNNSRVYHYVMKYGEDEELKKLMKQLKREDDPNV